MATLQGRICWACAAALLTLGLPAGQVSAAASDTGIDADQGPARFVGPDWGLTGGSLPRHVAGADFDGDGDVDVVSVNSGPTPLFGVGIGVVRGDGKGHLANAVTTDVGSGFGACDVAVGDWDGNAARDIVILSCTTGGPGWIASFTADGDGTFTERQQFTNGAQLQLSAGDLDGDGRDDFVTSQRGAAQVRIYLGNGDGTFDPPTTVTPSFSSYDLELADINRDGDLDLVGAAGGPVWTMLGNGDGTFGAQIFDFSDVVTGIELAIADFDRDHVPDVAVVDASGGHVGIGLGLGDGHFVDGDQIDLGARQVVWVTAGRVDRGRDIDLVVGLEDDSTASALLRGRGNGHFRAATHWVVGTAGLEMADLDADGRDDLLSFSSGRVYGSLARGKGFEAARLRKGPLAFDLVDLDGDGVLDKVSGVTSFTGGELRSDLVAQLGRGGGRFGPEIISPLRGETASSGVGSIAIGDIDEDGVPDVVGGFENFQFSPVNLFWALGNSDGSFDDAVLSDSGDSDADQLGVALADVTNDGHLDVLAHDLSKLVVRAGDGDGSFGAPIRSGLSGAGNDEIFVTDLTGDGELDVVTTVRTGGEDFGIGEIRLQEGHGNGTFTHIQTSTVDSNLGGGAIADLNGDDRPDVVTAGAAGFDGGRNAMWVLLTTASGRLGTPTPYEGVTGNVDTDDVDLDGDLDIATPGGGMIFFYLNDGDGLFPRIDDILAAGHLGVFQDLNDDGAPDVLAGGPQGEFAVHLNARG